MERQPKTADYLLAEARAKLPVRLSPEEAFEAISNEGAKLIDIRYLEQRMSGGVIPGAILINRNELEWRCDPSGEWRDEQIAPNDYDQMLIVLCNQGFQSSLAAANLQSMGLVNATDVVGGFEAWRSSSQPWIPYEDNSRA